MSTRWLPSVTSAGSIAPAPEGLLDFLIGWWLVTRGECPKRARGKPFVAHCLLCLSFGSHAASLLPKFTGSSTITKFHYLMKKCQRIWQRVLKPRQWCLILNLFHLLYYFLTNSGSAKTSIWNSYFSVWENIIDLEFSHHLFSVIVYAMPTRFWTF